MSRYPIKVFYSDEDKGYVAVVSDLPGCSAFGETEEAAVREAKEAVALWLKTAKKEGRQIPAASSLPSYSGKFLTRIPKTLHQRIAEKALDEGVSLNQYVEYVLARGVGALEKARAMPKFAMTKVRGGKKARGKQPQKA